MAASSSMAPQQEVTAETTCVIYRTLTVPQALHYLLLCISSCSTPANPMVISNDEYHLLRIECAPDSILSI